MGSFSIWHWLIVLVVVILIFGTKKLRNMGSDVGGAVNEFKKAINEDKPLEQATVATTTVAEVAKKPKTATKPATAKAKAPAKATTKPAAAKKPASKTAAKPAAKAKPKAE